MKVRTEAEEEAHIAQPCKTDPLTLFAARARHGAARRGTHEHEHALRLGLTRADVGWMVAGWWGTSKNCTFFGHSSLFAGMVIAATHEIGTEMGEGVGTSLLELALGQTESGGGIDTTCMMQGSLFSASFS